MHLVALSGICLGISLYEGRVRSDLSGRRLAAFSAAAAWLSAMAVCWSLWHDKMILENELQILLEATQQASLITKEAQLETQHAQAR